MDKNEFWGAAADASDMFWIILSVILLPILVPMYIGMLFGG